MDFPRGNAAEFTFGTGATAGPSPEAVAVVAQRLLEVATELHALRSRLNTWSTVNWSSLAATAFRQDLAQREQDIAGAGRSIEDAAGAVRRYGALLAAQELAALPGALGGVP